MDFSNLNILQVSREKMRYLGERQAVLAQNVANVDTADYKARDLRAPDFHQMAFPMVDAIRLRQTSAGHMAADRGTMGHYKIVTRDPSGERNPNDNKVELDKEIQKVAETQMEYNKVISIYRKNISLFKIALGVSGAG